MSQPWRRIVVDPIRCQAHGICAELFPEMIQLDDWGYPVIAPGPVPPELESHARRAVRACPTLALLRADAPPGGPPAREANR